MRMVFKILLSVYNNDETMNVYQIHPFTLQLLLYFTGLIKTRFKSVSRFFFFSSELKKKKKKKKKKNQFFFFFFFFFYQIFFSFPILFPDFPDSPLFSLFFPIFFFSPSGHLNKMHSILDSILLSLTVCTFVKIHIHFLQCSECVDNMTM